ncbi:fructosamine kinase family protein [Mucilaginibacter paludis]|uniref:Fructosamine/Ketosamine-3-kinase n=1 Tax=Mucilaginibacter paludis DSM 18603 TaxID=714943 RepID=H1YFK8_9SPHI|nr:fructosamine kinase family protein [Mucilaginibacter paludis]EHQ24410.1 Fructosamine/Ketosamine-3-kinase [Mucilaginibacter paludis DSM 18603]
MLSALVVSIIEQRLSELIINTSPMSGGSINQVYSLQTAQKKYVVKVNSKSKFPQMFACEATGLKTIAATATIAIPNVLFFDDAGEESFLVLEWIESKRPSQSSFNHLGQQLAAMHTHSAEAFGFDGDNYMGSLKQSNIKHDTWAAFYTGERLMPMVKIAVDNCLLSNRDEQFFEKLYARLPGLFEEEKPSLIHGDLWSGNYIIANDDAPYLIDPAVSYGHREFDIAMTTLFGGFGRQFYRSYHESFPLAKGWEQRLDLWNLYPLLLHLNLFGAGYLGQVRDGLAGYV